MNPHTVFRVGRGFLPALPALGLCLLLCGCPSTVITGPSSAPQTGQASVAPPAATTQNRDMSLAGQARSAWNANNMLEAERLYGIIARNPATAAADRLLAWERLALAGVVNKHPRASLEALEQWRQLSPAVENQPAWQDAWGKSLMHVGDSEALRAAEAVWTDPKRPVPLRGMAGGLIMALRPDASEALAGELNKLYETLSPPMRMQVEQRFLALLGEASDGEVVRLSGLTGPGKDNLFPWTIVLLEDLTREKLRHGPRMAELSARIDAPGVFADANLLKSALGGASQPAYLPTPGASVAFNSGCVALALPLSGPFAPIGQKVSRGATAAGSQLSAAGTAVSVVIIDTEAPDWLDKVSALPPQCVAVGGPMRAEAYAAAKSRNVTASRAFFAFLSGLEGEDEGRVAWRFFSSPEDQVAAMLRFTGQLGISSYGLLMPEDSFGQRMGNLFVRNAEAGGSSVKIASYAPDSANWSSLMSSFVGSHMVGKTPMSNATFQAVFLPDSWQRIEQMVPFLFYQGEDRLVLMGTALWEQSLANRGQINVQNMDLAIFPGAWNPLASNPAAVNLNRALAGSEGQEVPDVWNAIGYDFVRFASALNLNGGGSGGWTPQVVNERIGMAQGMDWSMAPIHWSQGRAAQQLFVLHPIASGFELVDEQAFRQRLDEIRARYARRK